MPTDHTPATAGPDRSLLEVRDRRADLHAALVAVEKAIARPAAGRAEQWAKGVHEALVRLGAEFERHIAVTEEPGGLFEVVHGAAPRLSGQVQSLATEHQTIRGAITKALDAVRPQAHPFGPTDATGGRDVVLDLLSHLLRHRQAGADLVYEAFETDLGGVD